MLFYIFEQRINAYLNQFAYKDIEMISKKFCDVYEYATNQCQKIDIRYDIHRVKAMMRFLEIEMKNAKEMFQTVIEEYDKYINPRDSIALGLGRQQLDIVSTKRDVLRVNIASIQETLDEMYESFKEYFERCIDAYDEYISRPVVGRGYLNPIVYEEVPPECLDAIEIIDSDEDQTDL